MKNRARFFMLFILCIYFICCSPKGNSDNLNENDLKRTTSRAINVIKQKNYKEFRLLFAPEIAKDISDDQMNKLVDQISSFLNRKAFPDDQNIVFECYKSFINNDSLVVNDIIYKFDNPTHSLHSYARSITFSFLPKYGPGKLCGVHITDDGN